MYFYVIYIAFAYHLYCILDVQFLLDGLLATILSKCFSDSAYNIYIFWPYPDWISYRLTDVGAQKKKLPKNKGQILEINMFASKAVNSK